MAMVVMVTMLALGIYLEPLPKVTNIHANSVAAAHALHTPEGRQRLAPSPLIQTAAGTGCSCLFALRLRKRDQSE